MSGSDMPIRAARPDDLDAVMSSLESLAGDLNDPFNAKPDIVMAALFGPNAHSVCLLAGPEVRPHGAVLFSPFVSTVVGHACIYVSDLWVAAKARGQSLGLRLLAAAAAEGAERWNARALYLNVYRDSTQAMDFYRHIGFQISHTDQRAALKGAAFDALMAGKDPA